MPDNLHSEHAQSRLAKRLIFRVMSYALTALIMLLLIQFYATYRLQIENRSSAINTALNNINPILELALWNYNFEEIFRLGESLNNDPQVSGVLIRDESRNTVFEAGLVNNLHKLYAKSEQIHELQLADSSTAYARQVWYRGAASEPLKIGEVIIGSEDDLIWREIFDTIVVLVIAQLVFVAIVLLVLYLAMQTVVSARLLLLGRSISKMEKDIDPSIELELETLISGNDELSDVYLFYFFVFCFPFYFFIIFFFHFFFIFLFSLIFL